MFSLNLSTRDCDRHVIVVLGGKLDMGFGGRVGGVNGLAGPEAVQAQTR